MGWGDPGPSPEADGALLQGLCHKAECSGALSQLLRSSLHRRRTNAWGWGLGRWPDLDTGLTGLWELCPGRGDGVTGSRRDQEGPHGPESLSGGGRL